jgi:formate hydrogenlyase subunit 3/multisubunit Na+/H+ antiporter MnhD subunit
MLTPEQGVMAAVAVCLAGAGLTCLLSRNRALAGWAAVASSVVSGALVLLAVGQVLGAGPSPLPAQFPRLPAFGFAWRLYVDGLTAVFLLLAVLIAVPAALYSVRYLEHYREYGAGRYYPHFLVFLAAMYGLVSTTDMMWFFFVFWQMMTLPGYALIRYEHRQRANVRAANKYLIMMQLACAATMIGAALLGATGAAAGGSANLKYDFDAVSANLPALLQARPRGVALVFGLFLVGFGIKMGMWPFGQLWLPDAHPAAPSPVSAMLSGVMIKTGVYGLIRYFLWLVLAASQGTAVFTPLALLVVLAAVFCLAGAVARAGGSARRVAAPWLCGYALEAEANRYRAHGFYAQFKHWFRWLGGAPPRGERAASRGPKVNDHGCA